MTGYMVLKAEEKSTNRRLAKAPLFSISLSMVSNGNSLASSTARLVQKPNWRGSRTAPVLDMLLDLTSFSKTFMTRDVRAMGLWLLREQALSFLGMGMIVEVFHGSGTTPWSTED